MEEKVAKMAKVVMKVGDMVMVIQVDIKEEEKKVEAIMDLVMMEEVMMAED